MSKTKPAVIKVKLDAAAVAKIVTDAVEEAMAVPVCEREHVEPLAQWEIDILASTVPRVVRNREDFEVGQIVALTVSGAEAIARVTKAEGRHVEVKGRYMTGEEKDGRITSPIESEVRDGHWLILKDAKR